MQTPIAGCVASALRGRNLNDNNGAGQKKSHVLLQRRGTLFVFYSNVVAWLVSLDLYFRLFLRRLLREVFVSFNRLHLSFTTVVDVTTQRNQRCSFFNVIV